MKKWVFFIFIFVSCSNNEIVEKKSTSAHEILSNKNNKDSLETVLEYKLIQISENDSCQFIKIKKGADYNSERKYHNLIWKIKDVQEYIVKTNSIRPNLWYTEKIDETDSTIQIGLCFIWERNKKKIERFRFKINKKSFVIQVNNTPLIEEYYIPLSKWENNINKTLDD